jgi:hypothetical protein
MAASLLLALVLIQGPTSSTPVAQLDDDAITLALSGGPVLAKGIQVQSEQASSGSTLASGGLLPVAPAPCAYYTYIAGATYCSAKRLSNGTIVGLAREDYLLWKAQQEIAKEAGDRARAAALSAEQRRLEAQRTRPAPIRSSVAGTSWAGPEFSAGQPRSAGTSSNFSGGMYTPAPRNPTGGATTGSSAPAKRGGGLQ